MRCAGYEQQMFPDALEPKLRELPAVLLVAEKANYRELFGREGRDAGVADALVRVAAGSWQIAHLHEIADFVYIRKH